MKLAELIQDLSSILALPGLELNSQGVCQIVIDDELVISVEEVPAQDRAHVYAVVATVGEPEALRTYSTLLGAQLFGRELGAGMSFALDEATSEILLQKVLTPSALNGDSLNQELAEFVNWADHWRTKLKQNGDAGAAAVGSGSAAEACGYVRA